MPYFLFGSEYVWSYFHVYTISGSEIMARLVLANLNANWEIEKKNYGFSLVSGDVVE